MKKMDKSRKSGEESDSGEMHFLDHLEEFRWVLIRSIVAFFGGVWGCS